LTVTSRSEVRRSNLIAGRLYVAFTESIEVENVTIKARNILCIYSCNKPVNTVPTIRGVPSLTGPFLQQNTAVPDEGRDLYKDSKGLI